MGELFLINGGICDTDIRKSAREVLVPFYYYLVSDFSAKVGIEILPPFPTFPSYTHLDCLLQSGRP